MKPRIVYYGKPSLYDRAFLIIILSILILSIFDFLNKGATNVSTLLILSLCLILIVYNFLDRLAFYDTYFTYRFLIFRFKVNYNNIIAIQAVDTKRVVVISDKDGKTSNTLLIARHFKMKSPEFIEFMSKETNFTAI